MTARAELATDRARIRTRLLAGFATLLLATFALACYAIYSIRTMNVLVARTYDNVLMASTYAQAAHTGFLRLDHATATALWAGTPAEFEARRQPLTDIETDVRENLEVVRKRTLVDASRRGIDELLPLYESWLVLQRASLEQAASRHDVNRLAAALAPAAQDETRAGADLRLLIEQALTSLVDREAEAGFALREASREVGERTLRIAYGFLAFVAALAVVGFLLLVRRVLRPLHEAHAESERLFASMSWVLIAVSGDDHVTRWNVAAETSFGTPATEAIGRSLADTAVSWDWEPVLAGLAEVRRTGVPLKIENVRYTRADGRDGFLRVTWNPLEAGAAGALLLGTDVTDLRVLETQLAQAQKLEAIGQLAAGVAHEINTPVQFIGDNVGFVETALVDLDRVLDGYQRLRVTAGDGPVAAERLEEIDRLVAEADVDFLRAEIPKALVQMQDGVQRVATIVRALKAFAHPDRAEMVTSNLNEALLSTLTVSQSETRYVANVETALGEIPPVLCRVGELNQAFLNIIVNAAHAIAGVVKDTGALGLIRVETRREGEHVVIEISDTGGGIPERVRDKIFEPFFTTKAFGQGTGQGLAIARSVVVKKHGGSIKVQTEVGRGTTFVIRLPIDGGARLSPPDPEPVVVSEDLSVGTAIH
jgi:PAS domain S-box-containing protein